MPQVVERHRLAGERRTGYDIDVPIHDDVTAYNLAQEEGDRAICDTLARQIDAALPGADNRIWHRHPVWFIDANPIVGYSKLKNCVRLLFWSGQSFDEPTLQSEGSFKAAEKRFTSVDDIDSHALARWLEKARTIQWDYKNIVKRRGVLERLR